MEVQTTKHLSELIRRVKTPSCNGFGFSGLRAQGMHRARTSKQIESAATAVLFLRVAPCETRKDSDDRGQHPVPGPVSYHASRNAGVLPVSSAFFHSGS